MVRTSIQALGAATTTLAWPKPSGLKSSSRASTSGTFSRSRSSPATPKCAAPAASWPEDLARRDIGDLDARQPGDGAAIVARSPPLDEFEPGAGEERGGGLLQ